MKYSSIRGLAIALIVVYAQSLLTSCRPATKRQFLHQLNVELSHEPPIQKKHHPNTQVNNSSFKALSGLESVITKYEMIAYVAHMCFAIPIFLLPTAIKSTFHLSSKTDIEHEALRVGQACAQTLLKFIPFMNLKIMPYKINNPVPTIWVSNHVSMLDTFVFLASDEELRGINRRPIKVIYWKGLDANPICRILFEMAGFIPVDMEDNGNGNPNQYHLKSFKHMIKSIKLALSDGFDLLLLPEGQLNPTPEQGLQPIFPGAFTLAKSSHRPIQMVGLHGCHNLWHADEDKGMRVTGRDVTIKAYPPLKNCETFSDFEAAFSSIVGTFGATGQDIPQEELSNWLDM